VSDNQREQDRRPWDTIADGIPRTEADAKFAGIPWDLCQELHARQAAVAACRRRAATNRDLLDRRLD
jgi:hypothetical protein